MDYQNIDVATAIEVEPRFVGDTLTRALEAAAAAAEDAGAPAPGDEAPVGFSAPEAGTAAIAFATVGTGPLESERSGNLYRTAVLYPAERAPDADDLALLEGRGPEPADRDVRAVLAHFQEHHRAGTGPVHTVYGICTASLEHATGVSRGRQKQRGGGVRELIERLVPVLPRAMTPAIPERVCHQVEALNKIARDYVQLCHDRGYGPPVTAAGLVAWPAVPDESGLTLSSVMRKTHVRRVVLDGTRDLPRGPVVDVVSPMARPEVVARRAFLKAALARWVGEGRPLVGYAGLRGTVDPAAFAREVDGAGEAGDPLDWHPGHLADLAAAAARCGIRRPGSDVPSRRTYGTLRDFLVERHGIEKGHLRSAPAVLANLLGAFGAVMELRGRALDDDPLDDLGPQLEDWLPKAGRSANFRSLVRQIADRLRSMAGLDHSWRHFRLAVADLAVVSGLSDYEIAERIGVDRVTVWNWRTGKVTPSNAKADAVERLEDLFGVPRGTLLILMRRVRRAPVAADAETPEQARLLARAARYMDPADQGAPLADRLAKAERVLAARVRQPSLYSARLIAANARRVVPVPGPEAPFWAEAEQVRAYRCAPVSLVGDRGGRGNWSAATADLHMKSWALAMGRLHLPIAEGGTGVAIEDLSLILFANPYGFLDQEVGRERELAAAGAGTRACRPILTSRTVGALIALAALFRPGTGWIWRNPDLLRRMVVLAAPLRHLAADPRFEMARADEAARVAMPQSLIDRFREDWTGACGEVERIYRQLASDVARLVESGRDPFEPIAPLAALPVPMAGFYRLMYESEKRWPDIEVDPYRHHLAVRMSVLVRIASLLFLRSKNLRKMTWLEDGTGHLRYVDGHWEVVIPWRDFKNSRNNDLFGPVGSRQDYHRRLPDQHGLYDLLRYYTGTCLPALRGRFPGSPYLFPTRFSPFAGAAAMTRRFHEWTREHCVHDAARGTGMPGLMLFGLHALRDLGATTLLKDVANPNRLQEAADLLQTSVAQVRHRYAKLGIVERLGRADPLLSTASDLALGGTPLWSDAA